MNDFSYTTAISTDNDSLETSPFSAHHNFAQNFDQNQSMQRRQSLQGTANPLEDAAVLWFGRFCKIYTIFIIFFGVFGNLISMIVLVKSSDFRRLRISPYLMALALSDTGFLTTLSLILLQSFGVSWPAIPGMCKIAYYIWYSTTFLSGWYVLAMAGQRCLVVYRPFLSLRVRQGFATVVVLVVTTLALIFNVWVPLVFQRDTYHEKEIGISIDFCDVNQSNLRLYESMEVFDTFVSFTFPLFGVLGLNILIGVKLSFAAKQRSALSSTTRKSTPTSPRSPGGNTSAEKSSAAAAPAAASGSDDRNRRRKEGLMICREKSLNISIPSTPAQKESIDTADDTESPAPSSNLTANGSNLIPRAMKSDGNVDDGSQRNIGSNWLTDQQESKKSLNNASRQHRTATGTTGKNSERKTTIILISISFAYCALNLPSYVLRMTTFVGGSSTTGEDTDRKEIDSGPSALSIIMEHSARMLFYTQFSVNFLLYSYHWLRDCRPRSKRRRRGRGGRGTTTISSGGFNPLYCDNNKSIHQRQHRCCGSRGINSNQDYRNLSDNNDQKGRLLFDSTTNSNNSQPNQPSKVLFNIYYHCPANTAPGVHHSSGGSSSKNNNRRSVSVCNEPPSYQVAAMRKTVDMEEGDEGTSSLRLAAAAAAAAAAASAGTNSTKAWLKEHSSKRRRRRHGSEIVRFSSGGFQGGSRNSIIKV